MTTNTTTNDQTKTTTRKPNGSKAAPKTKAEPKTKAAPKTETKKAAEPKVETPKAPKVKMCDRRDALKALLQLPERVQYETAETAVQGENSASVVYDNAIVLTLVSDETKKASRVMEIWLHQKRVDVGISRALYERMTTPAEDATDDQKARATAIDSYSPKIDRAHKKGSKYWLVLEDDAMTQVFTNLFLSAL